MAETEGSEAARWSKSQKYRPSSDCSLQPDYTIFVVRAGLYRLDMLPVIDEFYKSGKYPRMSVILNGTKDPTSRYARRYGTYAYGYGYGYGYEYGSSKSSKSK